MLVAAAGCFLYTLADAGGGLVAIIAGLAVMNLGCGPLITLGTGIVVGSVPSAKAGSAAAMSETSAEFGYAIGLAVVGSLGALVYRTHLAIAPDVPAELADGARESLVGATTSAAQLGPDGAALLDSAREAFTTSVHVVGWVAAAIALLVAVFDTVYFRHLPPIVSEMDEDASPPDHTADVEDWVCEGHAEA
jgi:DHA2 family multidrug resistance protein-like MFS transporter